MNHQPTTTPCCSTEGHGHRGGDHHHHAGDGGHGHGHHHHHLGDGNLGYAVLLNLGLTVVQVAGGVVSGSLALIADALHNLSDAISLIIAWAARRIARRPADASMTFGYGRAEIVAALVNFTTLIMLGLFLGYEAVMRLIDPQPVGGWIMVGVAGLALAVDVGTAMLTWRGARDSMNIRAAFLHNVADALSSVAVIVGGVLVLVYDWRLIDPILTLVISAYILIHGAREIGGAVRILMLGTPQALDTGELIDAVRAVPGVSGTHHVHLWGMDERTVSLEAHVVLDDAHEAARVKTAIRAMLRDRFGVAHVTLETEAPDERCQQPGGLSA